MSEPIAKTGIARRVREFIVEECSKAGSGWERRDYWMLGLCLSVAALMVSRTTGLIFEADDLRFFWWAIERGAAPWYAFTDPPLFSNYYRPVISLVWWLHVTLFGPEPFWHQIALGGWWMAVLVLLYFWGKRTVSGLAGFVGCAAFLATDAAHSLVLWKSWLTIVCALFFHLAALHQLQKCLDRLTRSRVAVLVLLFLTASFSKESALFCLPFTCTALVWAHAGTPARTKQLSILAIAALAAVLFFFTENLQVVAGGDAKRVFDLPVYLPAAGYCAYAVLGSAPLQAFAFTAVTLLLGAERSKPLEKLTVAGAAALSTYAFVKSWDVQEPHAVALALMVYVHGLWLSADRRKMAVPLIWMAAGLWPLAILRLQAVPYSADAALGLSLALGVAGSLALKRLVLIRRASSLTVASLPALTCAIAMTVLLLFSVRASMLNLFGRAGFGESVYHTPVKILKAQTLSDLYALQPLGSVSADLGNRIGMTANLALDLQANPNIELRLSPSPGSFRLEAYTGRNYHRRISDAPLDIFLPPTLGPPPEASYRDPYFMPERWETHTLSACDDPDAWYPPGQYSRGVLPLGQGGWVSRSIQASVEIQVMEIHFHDEPRNLQGRESFTLTFWLQTPRWDLIEALSVQLTAGRETYRWEVVEAQIVNSFSAWRRVVLAASAAEVTRKRRQLELPLQFRVVLATREVPKPAASVLGIDEIRISVPKGPG